jgi:hypothetical protein
MATYVYTSSRVWPLAPLRAIRSRPGLVLETDHANQGGTVGSYRRVIAAVALLALLGGACGSSSEDGGSPDTEAGAGGGESLAIAAPEDGGEVSLPFTLELTAADDLGPPESGSHHVHVFYDGDDSEYEVVTSDTFEVTDLAPGEHTLTASLRNADHSPAGTDVTIDLTVAGGGGGGSKSGGSKDSGPSDDTNYGY